jgi:outer membrane protein assembly factor BamD (BamD/ComL family)
MKKFSITFFAFALLLCMSSIVCAQGGVKQGPQIARDPDLEKDSLHNLEVARHYFKTRKAYVAALQRCEEIIAANPSFSKIDEVLFMAGESSLHLADNKGKQESSLYVIHEGDTKRTLTADQFRDLARDYLSQLVNGHPDSSYRSQAEESLRSLGGVKPKAVSSKQ